MTAAARGLHQANISWLDLPRRIRQRTALLPPPLKIACVRKIKAILRP